MPTPLKKAQDFIRNLGGLPPLQEALLHLLLAAVITGSVMTFPLNFIEAPLYDLRQAISHRPTVDDRIAIITIDDQTLNQLNEISPLPVIEHIKALNELERQEVSAVGYVVDFNKVNRLDASAYDQGEGQELYRSAVRLNAQGIPFMIGIPYDINGEVIAPYPLSQIPQAVAIVHRDGTIFGRDKVTRRALVSLDEKLAFEMNLVNRLYSTETISTPPGTYKTADANAEYFLLRMHQNNDIIYDHNYETFSYPRYSFVDLIEGKIPMGTLKNKIVLVGTFQRDNPSDFTLISPYSRNGLMPKILVQANILDSILNHQGIRQVPNPVLASICFLLSLILIALSFRVRPGTLILYTLLLLLSTFVISIVIFEPIPIIGDLWLPLGAPLLSLTLSFYLMIPLRLYSEHRKRYELEKENMILIQVEEMKTNFLQLVTHDLKTPVAKIQGLTEQLRRSLSTSLMSKDLELMNHLFAANEELNHFISSLLELTKLDNQGVSVNLQSRDLNLILDNLVDKLRFYAQAKNIRIQKAFEPLFPIKLDAELISKVLSNLIDNAIKYSPENTEVTISTREVEDFVEVSIQDQGIGIPEHELQNLFSRFYRIKNDTTITVKGTGLGLYLSKYFIEAHQGSISVKSQPQFGTQFLIRLPLNLKESDLKSVGLTRKRISNRELNKKEKTYA